MRVSQRVKGGWSVMQFKCRIWWIFRLLRSGCGASKCLIYLSPPVSSLLHCFSWVQKYELSYFFRVGGERERERERWGWPSKTEDREKAEGKRKTVAVSLTYMSPAQLGQMKSLKAATHCSISQNIYTNFDTCNNAHVHISKYAGQNAHHFWAELIVLGELSHRRGWGEWGKRRQRLQEKRDLRGNKLVEGYGV